MTHRRTIQHFAGPLFGAMMVLVTAALAFTPVVLAVGAIDPTPTPSDPAAPAPDPSPSPDPTPTPTATPTSCGSSLGARVSAATAGSTLDLTGCTYTAGATVNKALTIIGGTLRFPSGTTGLSITHNDVTVDGMTIAGTQHTYSNGEYGILVYTNGSPITGLVIKNCHVFSIGGEGIEVDHAIGAIISNNTVEDTTYAGIIVFSAAGGTITHNSVSRIGYTTDSQVNAYGIMVNDQGAPQSTDVVVSYNTVVDVHSWHGLNTHGGIRISFIGNTVQRCRRGLFITDSDTGPAANIVVTGNQIMSPEMSDPTTAVTLYNVAGATFTGNTISGWGPNSPTSSQPWFDFLNLSTGLTASSNTVTR